MGWLSYALIASAGLAVINVVPRFVDSGIFTFLAVGFGTAALATIPFAFAEGFATSSWLGLLIFGGALVFTNFFFTQSVRMAPNPGYSASLSQLAVPITFIVSFLFLDGELSLIKILGALLMVVGAVLISL